MDSLSTKEIVLEYVCPGLGVVIGNFMFAAPYRDLKAAIVKGDLGNLNPVPWGFMLGNCFGWVLYGILLQNLWIFVGNAPGFLLSVWLNLGAVKLIYQGHHIKETRESMVSFLQKDQIEQKSRASIPPSRIRVQTSEDDRDPHRFSTQQDDGQPSEFGEADAENEGSANEQEDWATIVRRVTSQRSPAPGRHETIVMIIVTVWLTFGTILAFVDAIDLDDKIFMVGVMTNVILIFFYGGPLSTIGQVLKEKHTASIHIPTMILNTLNSSFWMAYGIAIGDFFLYVPNGLGALFGGIQILLCMTFPRTPSLRINNETKETSEKEKKSSIPSRSSFATPKKQSSNTRNEANTSLDLDGCVVATA